MLFFSLTESALGSTILSSSALVLVRSDAKYF